MSRELDLAVRRFADQNSDRVAEIPADRHFRATVTSVTAGAARDGNSLVTVTWRLREFAVADYPDTYTPAVNDRVLCVMVDNQPSILTRGVGYP